MKMASKKQQYVCAWIYNYVNHDKNTCYLHVDSEDFAEELSAQEAWLYTKEHEDVYKILKDKWQRKKDIRAKRVKERKMRYDPDTADNAYGVTDYIDCFDFGIFPWGDS